MVNETTLYSIQFTLLQKDLPMKGRKLSCSLKNNTRNFGILGQRGLSNFVANLMTFVDIPYTNPPKCRSQWPRCLKPGSAAARLLGLWVRIPLGAWMSVGCECCVLSGRSVWGGLITTPEESYRVWCVWVWSWILDNEEALAIRDCCTMKKVSRNRVDVSNFMSLRAFYYGAIQLNSE